MAVFKLIAKLLAVPIILVLVIVAVCFLLKGKFNKTGDKDSRNFVPPPIQQWTSDAAMASVPRAAAGMTQKSYVPDLEQGQPWQPVHSTALVKVSWSLRTSREIR